MQQQEGFPSQRLLSLFGRATGKGKSKATSKAAVWKGRGAFHPQNDGDRGRVSPNSNVLWQHRTGKGFSIRSFWC